MAFDALSLGTICKELQQKIIGGKITKIYQPEKDEIVLFIFNKTTYKLLISANASVNRIHLTTFPTDNPKTAPSFCMLLRKHLNNATFLEITQMPFERVLDFLLEIHDDLGYECKMHLIFELTGKTSNIVLTEESYIVIDTIKHLPQDIDSSRVIVPGAKYNFFTPQNKIAPNDFETVSGFLSTCKAPLRTALTENLLGVSQNTINEISSGIDENDHTLINNQRIVDSLQQYMKNLQNPQPCIVMQNGVPVDVCPFPYKSKKGDIVYFNSVNEAHDNYYYLLDKHQRFNDKAKSITTLVKNTISRTEKKLAIQHQSILDAQNMEQNKIYGDLILANIYQIKKNDDKLVCQNYYEEDCPTITINLDKSLTPQQNAQNYYKLYRKQKSSVEHNTLLVEENEKLLDYLQTIKQSLKFCTEPQDLEEIRNELTALGIIKETSKKKVIEQPVKPLSFNIHGFNVYVGKNNVQNNFVTFKLAKQNDIWLHTKDIHSSHVIIVTNGESVPDNVIVEASEICAYYSQASNGTKIPVDYTFKQFVKKPPRAPLGFVIYNNEKTILVTPNRHSENINL